MTMIENQGPTDLGYDLLGLKDAWRFVPLAVLKGLVWILTSKLGVEGKGSFTLIERKECQPDRDNVQILRRMDVGGIRIAVQDDTSPSQFIVDLKFPTGTDDRRVFHELRAYLQTSLVIEPEGDTSAHDQSLEIADAIPPLQSGGVEKADAPVAPSAQSELESPELQEEKDESVEIVPTPIIVRTPQRAKVIRSDPPSSSPAEQLTQLIDKGGDIELLVSALREKLGKSNLYIKKNECLALIRKTLGVSIIARDFERQLLDQGLLCPQKHMDDYWLVKLVPEEKVSVKNKNDSGRKQTPQEEADHRANILMERRVLSRLIEHHEGEIMKIRAQLAKLK